MSYAAARIDEFHEAFGVKAGKLSDDARQRRTLHDEEHDELHGALNDLGGCACSECTRTSPIHARLEAVAEELADVLVIAYGTADVLGIDLDTAFAIKMNANMAKLPECTSCDGTGRKPRGTLLGHVEGRQRIETGLCHGCGGTGKGKPIKRHDGKIEKGPNYVKPDFSEAIK